MVERLEESGWRDQVKGVCKDVVKERGLDKITVEDLVQVKNHSLKSDRKIMRFLGSGAKRIPNGS